MTSRASPTGTADTVYIILGHVGQFKVDHLRQLVDIQASRPNIGSNQHSYITTLETSQRLGPCTLALVAMDRGSADAIALQTLRQAVGDVFGTGKDQHLFPVMAAHQMGQ